MLRKILIPPGKCFASLSVLSCEKPSNIFSAVSSGIPDCNMACLKRMPKSRQATKQLMCSDRGSKNHRKLCARAKKKPPHCTCTARAPNPPILRFILVYIYRRVSMLMTPLPSCQPRQKHSYQTSYEWVKNTFNVGII